MISLLNLDHLTPEQLRALAAQLMQRVETLDQQVETMGKTVETMGKKISRDQTLIEKLTFEIAQPIRLSPQAHRRGRHSRPAYFPLDALCVSYGAAMTAKH